MTRKTTIEWTHMPGFVGASWNPTVGCTRVSAGCDNCYAFALHDKRQAANRKVSLDWWSKAPTKRLLGDSQSLNGLQQARLNGAAMPFPKQYDLRFSKVQLLEDRLDVPLRTRKPTCYFVDSMADLFHEDVPFSFLDKVWTFMGMAERHIFLILTKRPERMREYLNDHKAARAGLDRVTLLPNVWLGTSVEDQRSADERIPQLLATPAAVRFLSCEPLLGPVDLKPRPEPTMCLRCGVRKDDDHYVVSGHEYQGHGIDWVIVGGESGSHARPMDLDWARSLVDQCRAAGVAVFVKQMGSAWGYDEHAAMPRPKSMRESHGRDMSEWPEDLRIREWPR